MKICPVCQTTYNDALRFCTKDGTPLASFEQSPLVQIAPETFDNVSNESSTPNSNFDKTSDFSSVESATQVSPPPPVAYQPSAPARAAAVSPNQTGRKSNTLWLAALGTLIGLGVLGAAAGVWWFSPRDDRVAVIDTNVNADPTPVSANQNLSNSEVLTSNVDVNSNLNADSDNNLNLNANVQTNTNVNLRLTPKPSPSPSPNERNSNRNNANNRTTLGINAAPVVAATPQTRPNVQPTPNTAERKTIVTSGGVVNGKATSLPKPVYPQIARTARAAGQVQVVVLINESGNVETARAVSGSPLLRGAAEAAARQARFSPTILSGQPVKVSGVIVYNFVL